jgi:hypothetical protein
MIVLPTFDPNVRRQHIDPLGSPGPEHNEVNICYVQNRPQRLESLLALSPS